PDRPGAHARASPAGPASGLREARPVRSRRSIATTSIPIGGGHFLQHDHCYSSPAGYPFGRSLSQGGCFALSLAQFEAKHGRTWRLPSTFRLGDVSLTLL